MTSRGGVLGQQCWWALVAQAEAILIRLWGEQEGGGGPGAASQEGADCIPGGDRWRERWKGWIRGLLGKAPADKARVSFWGSCGFY